MIKADSYLKETIDDILSFGNWDDAGRAKWKDGTSAHAKYVTQKVFKYDILNGEFPITTLRNTALRGAFYDIEAIYIKQTNIIEEMHPSIWSWWEDFVVETETTYFARANAASYNQSSDIEDVRSYMKRCVMKGEPEVKVKRSIGKTYGHTVKRYGLMNKLLEGMEKNPFGRRHMINLWQEQQMQDDPKALVPCAYQTNWNISEEFGMRYVDMTLHQRSQDFCMTASINPAQYVMLGMMICGHLTYKTGIKHKLSNFMHIVENCHIYDRHIEAAQEILEREPINYQPQMFLEENKNFYDYKWEDFGFFMPVGIKPLSTKLELAV